MFSLRWCSQTQRDGQTSWLVNNRASSGGPAVFASPPGRPKSNWQTVLSQSTVNHERYTLKSCWKLMPLLSCGVLCLTSVSVNLHWDFGSYRDIPWDVDNNKVAGDTTETRMPAEVIKWPREDFKINVLWLSANNGLVCFALKPWRVQKKSMSKEKIFAGCSNVTFSNSPEVVSKYKSFQTLFWIRTILFLNPYVQPGPQID